MSQSPGEKEKQVSPKAQFHSLDMNYLHCGSLEESVTSNILIFYLKSSTENVTKEGIRLHNLQYTEYAIAQLSLFISTHHTWSNWSYKTLEDKKVC